MKRTNICPKCGSSDVIADAKGIDRAHYNAVTELSVGTFRKPEALLFKGRLTSTLSAWVCADCGYVEFYADSPKSIKTETQKTSDSIPVLPLTSGTLREESS